MQLWLYYTARKQKIIQYYEKIIMVAQRLLSDQMIAVNFSSRITYTTYSYAFKLMKLSKIR